MPIEESAIAGQKIGTLRPVGGGQDPVAPGLLPEILAELVEELARGVRAPLQRQREGGDPLVVVDRTRPRCA